MSFLHCRRCNMSKPVYEYKLKRDGKRLSTCNVCLAKLKSCPSYRTSTYKPVISQASMDKAKAYKAQTIHCKTCDCLIKLSNLCDHLKTTKHIQNFISY